MSSAARLRDRPVLDAQVTTLQSQVGAAVGPDDVAGDFARGALDALVWLTQSGPGPLTGVQAVMPVGLEMIVAELATAEDLIYGRPSRCREYARGVQHGLMWAQYATATPPARQASMPMSTPRA